MNQRDRIVDQQVESLLINLVKIVQGKGGVPVSEQPAELHPECDNVASLCDDIADECQRIKEIQTSLGYN